MTEAPTVHVGMECTIHYLNKEIPCKISRVINSKKIATKDMIVHAIEHDDQPTEYEFKDNPDTFERIFSLRKNNIWVEQDGDLKDPNIMILEPGIANYAELAVPEYVEPKVGMDGLIHLGLNEKEWVKVVGVTNKKTICIERQSGEILTYSYRKNGFWYEKTMPYKNRMELMSQKQPAI